MNTQRGRTQQTHRYAIAATLLTLATAARADTDATRPDAGANPRLQKASPVSSPDKTTYNLFNPTPPALMRDFNTDRPSQTTTPFTVDAGHVQVETSLFTYTYDDNRSGGDEFRTNAYSVLATNLRVGLLDAVEADVLFLPYNRLAVHERNFRVSTVEHGFGDTTVQLKWNLFGNDGGDVAFGVVPFATFPTSGEGVGGGGFMAGAIFPVAIKLPLGFNLGVQTELYEARNSSGTGHHVDWVNSAVLDHTILPKLDGYVEIYTDASRDPHAEWSAQFDTGLSYQISDNVSVDAGANLGVTKTAPEFMPFVGLSVRF